ncbi:MAG: 4-(cytidine 5'-diphospho)-2-C-methyl-D-erythritol kinase [Lachnospiraceae bacterium]|nr:4-(cytidine 5'-diphospho)-2-C-methyl-D-erythritol kinase [Lachnospiraceae bacterium]
MSKWLTEQANAKVNLSLDVKGKLDNGYHTVRMIMQSISLCDHLQFTGQEEGNGITLNTDSDLLNGEMKEGSDNLILKAARLLEEYTGCKFDAKITLSKNIPIAAGLGGGSSDAAATLRGLNRLFELGLSTEELQKIAVKIGADVPFCVKGGLCLAEGIGEVLTELTPLSNIPMVLCKPDIGVSTPAVYKAFDALEKVIHPDVDAMLAAIERYDNMEVLRLLGNALEPVTVSMHPVIKEIEENMMKASAINAIMSGSGPTVFGVFDSQKAASEAGNAIKKLYPGYQTEICNFSNNLKPRFE